MRNVFYQVRDISNFFNFSERSQKILTKFFNKLCPKSVKAKCLQNYSWMELQYDPDKNHIKLKFCTEVREHPLSDPKKKAPSTWPWESPLQ